MQKRVEKNQISNGKNQMMGKSIFLERKYEITIDLPISKGSPF